MNNNTQQSSYSQDVVGIFDMTTFNQLFTNARAIKAKVTEVAEVMTHPVEDGTSIVDHKVIKPIEIDLSVIINSEDYRNVYESIKTTFQNSTLLNVQTMATTYRSLIISAMPHDEDSAMYEALSIGIKLTEVKIAKVEFGSKTRVSNPRNANNSKTSDNGKQQPQQAPQQSVLFGLLK